MKKGIFVLGAGLMALASCTQKPVTATGPATSTMDRLAQGKTIYENSCARCHDLPEPTAHNSVEWVGIMNSMAPKAKLNEEQHQMVYDYVVSVKN